MIWQKLLLKSVITVGLLSWVTKGLEKTLRGNNFPFFLKRSNQCKFAEQWHILMWIEQIMRDHLWQNNKNLLEKMFNRIFLYHIYCFYSSINNEESTNCLEYFDTFHICCWKNIFYILLSFLHLVVKMRLVQFCSIKRSSVCGLKFGGGVVFSQICSVASGAFKEQYTLLVSLNLSVNERKPSTSSDCFFLPILKPKNLLISTICVIACMY